MYRPARRLAEIAPFHVVELLTRARQLEAEGRDIIHMEIGEPDFPTPEPIAQAAVDAIKQDKTLYTQALGLPELREAISMFYRERYGANVPAARIAVTSGASGALNLAFACLAEPGSQWLLTDPGYPCNRHILRVYEGRPQHIPVGPETNFQPTPELLRQHWNARTTGLLVASPANPTGTLLSLPEIAALAEVCRANEGHFLVDEIYHGLTYEIDAPTACAAGDDIWVINSFSKYFQMTGWRLGWMVIPEVYVRDIEKLAQNLVLCPSTPAQHATSSGSAGIIWHRPWSASASGIPPVPKAPFISTATARHCAKTALRWPATCLKRLAWRPRRDSISGAIRRKGTSALPTRPASTAWSRPSTAYAATSLGSSSSG